ncbi:MAG: alpha/beta hydrolase [Steroidobacteraceae bacterium]
MNTSAPMLEPQTQAFIDSLAAAGGPPLYTMTPGDARAVLADAQAKPVDKLPAEIKDTTFPVGPTGSVRIRIVRPPGVKEPLPVLFHIHGGGWILGDKDTHDRLTRELAIGSRAAVVFVDYERSPEARYPVAIEQAYASILYVVEHAKDLNVDASRLAIFGDSVGGDMSAALMLMAKERRGPQFSLQVLFYPVTDANFETDSYNEFADGPWLTKKAMQWFWDAYLPDPSARKHPTATPLNATLEQLRGLPEALVVVDENDVLRDEGEAYARELSQAGVRVTSERYNGTIHDFVLLNAIADTPAVRSALAQATAALQKALYH